MQMKHPPPPKKTQQQQHLIQEAFQLLSVILCIHNSIPEGHIWTVICKTLYRSENGFKITRWMIDVLRALL